MTRSGAPASVLPQCKFFEQMRFLHEKTANKPTESNITPTVMDVSVVNEGNLANTATTNTTSQHGESKIFFVLCSSFSASSKQEQPQQIISQQ